MCGIAGVFSCGAELGPADKTDVEQMLSALIHRGPDSHALRAGRGFILGNTRLKITDPSENAALPMSNEDGSVILAYNGAVTNFIDLKQELRLAEKHRFKSSSDAEVLVHLYEEEGIRFLRRLTGMFAFCLYDARRQKAYLARDFFGLRPVFYMVKNGKLYFASTIKAFLELACFEKKLNIEAIHHFLSLAYIPGELTPFEDIKELGGGEYIEIDTARGTWSKSEYYRLNYEQDDSLTEAGAASHLRDLLFNSLERNLAVDAPVGLTLSGGVDTGGLLGMLKALGRSRRTHTFSIRVGDPSFDESRYQKILVDYANPIHHEIGFGVNDVRETLITHLSYMDEPSGDGAAIPLFLLAKEAKRYVSILLSGEGGDEIFNAYETHRAFKARKMYRAFAPAAARRMLLRLAKKMPVSFRKLSLDFVAKRFTRGAELDAPGAHLLFREAFSEEDKRRLFLNPDGFAPTDETFRALFRELAFDDDLNKISFIDLKHYFIDDLMVKNDRMLMAHSIEGRYPYMDRPVVEFAARIPVGLKLKGFSGRYIQKKALENLLPPAILRRKNMGLEMPYSLWFLRELRPLMEEYLAPDRLGRCGLFSHAVITGMWQEHLSRKKDHGRALWSLLSFLVWFDLFIYQGDHKAYRRHAADAQTGA